MQIHPSLINPLLKTCKASSYGRFLLIKSLHKVLTQHDKVTALFLDLDTAPIYLNVLCHWWRASPGKLLLQVMPLKPISTRSWSSCLAPERQRERERDTTKPCQWIATKADSWTYGLVQLSRECQSCMWGTLAEERCLLSSSSLCVQTPFKGDGGSRQSLNPNGISSLTQQGHLDMLLK